MATKYILDPSGKILKKDALDGNYLEDAYNVSKDYLSRQKNYKESISFADVKLGFNVLPLGGIAAALTDVNITDEQKATLKTDNIFPENIFGSLVNSSFGFDNDSPLKNYTSFDSFNGDFQNSSVFADELEILAGYDFNSLGFISAKGADLTALAFVAQYLINAIVYIIVANEIYNFFITDNISGGNSDKFTNFERFFSDHLGLRFFGFEEMALTQVIVSFIHGFDLFLNADPKNVNWLNENPITSENIFFAALEQLRRTIFSFSKQGYNRLNMLIRKFQMQSYWHTNILYKAKTSQNDYIGIDSISQENPIDKFFVEFSRYYFKFIIERVQIGKISAGYKSFKTRAGVNVLTSALVFPNRYSANKRAVLYTNGLSTLEDPQDFYDFGDLKFKSGYGKDGANELYVDKVKSSADENKVVSDVSSSTLKQLIKYDFELLTTNRKDFKKYKYKGAASQNKRFSKRLKDEIEEFFNKEMAPFYFHDLRTNEMLSFHAFIDNISDSFQPQYNAITGFGRIDDAQHYTKTTRSISVSFSLVTMNEEDFSLMWQQINKLVTLVYPQWSDGLPANTGDFKKNESFRFPFTQVPTASPLIRLKVGDLIRSNYTEYDMKKLYSKGIKNKFNKKIERWEILNKTTLSFNTIVANSKFVPIIKLSEFRRPPRFKNINTPDQFADYLENTFGPSLPTKPFYQSSASQLDYMTKASNSQTVAIRALKKKEKFVKFEKNHFEVTPSDNGTNKPTDILQWRGFYIFQNLEGISDELFIIPDYSVNIKTFLRSRPVYDLAEDSDEAKLEKVFPAHLEGDKKINNPYQKAFESTQGLGLAGFITSLSIDTNNQLWETTNVEGRYKGDVSLPMGAKITIQFAPIHDIPPGIDATGVNRAEIYRDVITDMKERERS